MQSRKSDSPQSRLSLSASIPPGQFGFVSKKTLQTAGEKPMRADGRGAHKGQSEPDIRYFTERIFRIGQPRRLQSGSTSAMHASEWRERLHRRDLMEVGTDAVVAAI
jgi:hypothetical protein